MFRRRTYFGNHLIADAVALAGEHLAGQKTHDRRKVGFLIEFGVRGLDGVAAQQRRHRQYRQVQTRPAQVHGVGIDDLAPVRIQIGLGDDRRGDRANLDGLLQEPHLRRGELLAGVADEEHCIRVGQQSQRGRKVRLPLAADSRGVDERQASGQQRAGCVYLEPQHPPAGRPRIAAQVVAQIVDRNVDRFPAAPAIGDHQSRRRFGGVRHDRYQHRALVVPDPRDGHVQQGVEQLTLALLELAGDDHPDGRVGDPLSRGRQPGRQIGPVVEFGDGAGVVDQLDDHRNLAPVLRLAHLSPVTECFSHGMSLHSRTRRGPGEGFGCPAAPPGGPVRSPGRKGDYRTPATGCCAARCRCATPCRCCSTDWCRTASGAMRRASRRR